MTKNELEKLIHGAAAAMIYGYYFAEYTKAEGVEARMIETMRTKGYKFQAPDLSWEGLEADQLHATYSDPAGLRVAKGNMLIFLRLSLVRLAFETILQYVREHGHLALAKQEPWFFYARIVRNVTSHRDHAIIEKWDKELTEKGVSSATWRHRTVTTADIGKLIEFDSYDAWKLHLDMLDFVQKRLP